MTQRQIELLEYALRQITRAERASWQDIPNHLRSSFARYMDADVWTHNADLATLRDAALKILRDAIARTGEFSSAGK